MWRETATIALMNLRNLPTRRRTSSVVVAGIAGVVAVLVGLLAMAAGYSRVLARTSQPDRAIVLRSGTDDEISSWLSVQSLDIVSRMEGIEVASGELYLPLDLPRRDTGALENVVGRGVGPEAFRVRPELRVVRGRTFAPGRHEVLVGVAAVRAYAGLEVGERIDLRGTAWTVVGHFESGGDSTESEVWMDAAPMQAAFRRPGTFSSIRLRLADAGQAGALDERLRADPRLELMAVAEDDFFASHAAARAALIESFSYLVAGIMAVGAVAAGLNTMYSAVSARRLEIATLRALGFASTPIVVSVLVEALVLALLGGLLGGAVVYLAFDGYSTTALNSASLSQVVFDFAVTPALLARGFLWALVLGLLGAAVPALHAVRTPVVEGLRAR